MFKEKETIKIKYWSAFLGRYVEDEAVVMTAEEFRAIKDQKETPDWVYISDNGKVLFNEHTCLSSYRFGGNCGCLNHPHKKWVEYGEVSPDRESGGQATENFSKKLRENSFIGRFSDPKNPVDGSPFKE